MVGQDCGGPDAAWRRAESLKLSFAFSDTQAASSTGIPNSGKIGQKWGTASVFCLQCLSLLISENFIIRELRSHECSDFCSSCRY